MRTDATVELPKKNETNWFIVVGQVHLQLFWCCVRRCFCMLKRGAEHHTRTQCCIVMHSTSPEPNEIRNRIHDF